MNQQNVIIYALIDPRTNEARYVGKTRVPINIRLTAHLRDLRPSRKRNWIRSLVKAGLRPSMKTLEVVREANDSAEWEEAERFWISYLRSIGCNLTNLTEGGEGLHGLVFTEDHRKKIGDAHRGRKRSSETIERLKEQSRFRCHDHLRRLAISQRGKKLTEEHKAKIAKAGIGRRHSDETKQKMRAAALGRKFSKETLMRMSIAQKNRSKEHTEKIAAARRGKKLPKWHCEKLSLAQIGRKHPPETIAKMKLAWARRKQTQTTPTLV